MNDPAKPAPVRYVNLAPGDPAPWFHQRSTGSPNYAFDTVAGRYVVLCFFASAAQPAANRALEGIAAHRHLFDDTRACFFGVSIDPRDEKEGRVCESMPGIRFFWDQDGAISRLYGSIPSEGSAEAGVRLFWLVLDPALRVIKALPLTTDGSEQAALFSYLENLPPPERFMGFEVPAPILILHNVFEAELCAKLIGLYEAHGGEESGFMREVNGKTVLLTDPRHKRRKDYNLDDAALIQHIQGRVKRRIVPELSKVFAFKATRMERYIVSCYAAEDGGHFRAHRDNTTRGTAHRRFAVSINLNADFEGGVLSFPEYGAPAYKAPVGAAVIFPCALMHAVSKIERGRRYAFLPFLYDDEAAKLREANNRYLDENVAAYTAAAPKP